MTYAIRTAFTVGVLFLAGSAGCAEERGSPSRQDCRIGTYHLGDGADVDIGPSDKGKLRWRKKDGTTGALTKQPNGVWISKLGWTERYDGITVAFDCARSTIRFGGASGTKIQFDVTDTVFDATGARLAGRLVLPGGTSPVPIVVLVHGSEHDSARDFYALQRLFPSEGIGAFVYDKRGTGASGGSYTQDYNLLAKDAVAALGEARRLAGSRAGRVGYQAGSQGGWVSPLAATQAPVDFVVVGFGLAVSPIEEDRECLALDMTRHGFGPDVVAKVMEIADATQAIAESGFQSGFERLDALRAKYANEPWFKFIRGNITHFLLELPHDEVRKRFPVLFAGLMLHYDPIPVLRKLETPQLWILGADDIDAPSAETLRRLMALARERRPIVAAVFPHAEHGIYEYETASSGERTSTRNSDGYFVMMRDFIRDGRLRPAYGDSAIFRTRSYN